ncbi:SRPBCC family protein [Spirillospora sp. NBC_00431]
MTMMTLEHRVTIPAPVSAVWDALLDVERIAPCMPGAVLDGHEGDEFAGSVKVRVGAIQMAYRGRGRFVERDAAARRVVVEAAGKEARGSGSASATITVTLHEENGTTSADVRTELSVSGRAAQFGRGIIGDVGDAMLGRFAAAMADRLAETSVDPVAPRPMPEPAGADPAGAEPLDLTHVAASAVGKRLAGAVAVLAVLMLVRALRLRTQRRRNEVAP